MKPLRPFEFEAIGTLYSLSLLVLIADRVLLSAFFLATTPEIRSLLASSSLRTTLTRLLALPRYAREPSLRLLLSLPPEPSTTQYRPDPSRRFATGIQTKEEQQASERGGQTQYHSPNYRGRGGPGGVRGRGRGAASFGRGSGMRLLESTPEERKEIEGFMEEVRKVIQEAREKKGA